jgi:hypothetical protein
MRRYFFHIADERGWTKDHEGSQFDSDEAAHAEAAKAGKLIVGQKMIKGMALQAALAGKIVVTDEDEQVLFTLTLSDAAHAGETEQP